MAKNIRAPKKYAADSWQPVGAIVLALLEKLGYTRTRNFCEGVSPKTNDPPEGRAGDPAKAGESRDLAVASFPEIEVVRQAENSISANGKDLPNFRPPPPGRNPEVSDEHTV